MENNMENNMDEAILWETVLTDSQIREIEREAETLELDTGTVLSTNEDPHMDTRISKTGFFDKKAHPQVIGLGETLSFEVNKQLYGFNIYGSVEAQLALYQGSEGSHYNWHMDLKSDSPYAFDRKITTIVILSNPEEYKGGALEVSNRVFYNLPRGSIISFPSYLMHKVHRVTEGIRVSLVFWAEGPRFR